MYKCQHKWIFDKEVCTGRFNTFAKMNGASDYYLKPDENFFIYITARTSYILMR